ncbi:MAG: YgiQ family radical SAM protein [Candidatus Omnitrophota bacterium]
MNKNFLPISKKDMDDRGWHEVDVILVTGDAYVDHPSYGAAVIGRVLESAGFRVGVIAQPDWRKSDDFLRLGRPKLFFGITAGNLDSMLAKYTASMKIRSGDDYSHGGRSGLRPDRAGIIYTNKVKELFPGVPVVLGGLEASMRRLAHYDYWSDKVRRSILLDSKADILVYGMGERQILEIASRLKDSGSTSTLFNIRGTVIARNSASGVGESAAIPSFEEIVGDNKKFNDSFKIIYLETDPFRGKTVIQKHGDRHVIQFPPAVPMTIDELDKIYSLDYARAWHPSYDKAGGVPGFETVRFSVTSHRGCPGACNFCSLYLHQGRIVQSRSQGSILSEIRHIASRSDFKGTITDIGGPTANLYRSYCELWKGKGSCSQKMCLTPAKCSSLKLGYPETLKLWHEALKIPKVKHIFIGSGVRYDLLLDKQSDEYLKALCKDHISGYLKVAPEHSNLNLLKLMNKPSFGQYKKFVDRFNETNALLKKKQYLVNYLISGHPGAGLDTALELSISLQKMHIHPEQIQDFIPLPMTMSGCMYHAGLDPLTGKTIYVAKGLRERKLQRSLVQYAQLQNRKYIIEALRKLDRMELMDQLKPGHTYKRSATDNAKGKTEAAGFE